MNDEQEEVERVRDWVGRLLELASSLDDVQGPKAIDFCENACDAWQHTVSSDPPPPTSPAILIVLETFRALAQVMLAVAMDDANTPDARDRMTRDFAQAALKDALDGIYRDGDSWLREGAPSDDEIKERISAVGASLKAAQEEGARQIEKETAEEAEADPYGAILGYHDPAYDDVAIIFTKVCSFTADENKRYGDAYERIRRMLDSELLRHASDESDRICDVLMALLVDLRDNRIPIFDEDAWDERRRQLRSALISFTSALHSHKDQSIRAVRDAFGRRSAQEQAVLQVFNELSTSSFEYRWLVEMRDALLHGDINAFKYDFSARLHGEPAVNVFMDRRYMLQFTREHRNKPWLNRGELEQMTSDPSVLDMIKAVQPLMGPLQDKLDAILYPNVADDAATVKELIGRFIGRRGVYALQNGPGFTRRNLAPPLHRLAPRVLSFADTYEADGGAGDAAAS